MKIKKAKLFKEGFIKGFGWSFGVTVGFVVVSTILVWILKAAGGLPVVGNFFASIVESTVEQLSKRTPVIPN